MQRLLKVSGTNTPIVVGDEFARSGRVSASSENVLDLGRLGQRMQVGGACRSHRCPSRLARSRSVRALGCRECRPRSVAQSLPSLTTSSELPRGVDRVSRPQVVRLIALEHLEHRFRARCSERGDLTKILLAQNDPARFPCHDSILDHCAGQPGGWGGSGCSIPTDSPPHRILQSHQLCPVCRRSFRPRPDLYINNRATRAFGSGCGRSSLAVADLLCFSEPVRGRRAER